MPTCGARHHNVRIHPLAGGSEERADCRASVATICCVAVN
jgi:hypothetical protein